MKLERSKNAIRNTSFGVINKIVMIIFPFIVRTVFIHTLGAEFLGMNSLFTSILTVLSLAELGFGNAIVFSMYKPIAEDDIDTINALLYYYRKIYHYIGSVMLIVGIALIPLLPSLINGTYPNTINLTLVYLIYLLNSVLSYFMFGYLGAIISSHQREDILSKVNIVICSIMYFIQILVLVLGENYYAYLTILPIFTIINNLTTAYIAKKTYPQYYPKGRLCVNLKKDIRQKIGGLVISKLTNVTRNSFDSIFISMYLGLLDTAIYNNYYYILNSISAILIIVPTSINAGAGNSVAMESVRKNYNDMNRVNFLYMWIAGWFSVCMLCLFQPFMRLWVGENYLFPLSTVILLCIYFYSLKMGDIRSVYVGACGIWWEVRYRAIIEALVNIILNWILGKYFGVAGIITATLVSLLLINFLWGSTMIFKYYFVDINPRDYYLRNIINFIITCIAAFVTFKICVLIQDKGIISFLVKTVICMVIPNIIFLLFYYKTSYYKESMLWVRNVTKQMKKIM